MLSRGEFHLSYQPETDRLLYSIPMAILCDHDRVFRVLSTNCALRLEDVQDEEPSIRTVHKLRNYE